MSCISAHDPQLARLADAIAQRVGPQRFHVWFNNSTKLDLKQDGLEIAVPNDFISEWIGRNFSQPIQDAAQEVLGTDLPVRFSVVPQLFEARHPNGEANGKAMVARVMTPAGAARPIVRRPDELVSARAAAPTMRSAPRVITPVMREVPGNGSAAPSFSSPSRLRHDLETFIVGAGSQLAYNAAMAVADNPGQQFNPLFIHGACGLGKTHLLQGLCRRFISQHPARRWMYMTGEEFTNEFLAAMRGNRLDAFRRKMRELDLLVIDDVHFLSGKRATQEEFLHTFNAIEAMGRQVVMASDNHPKMIEEFGESLINRFVSGMVVRIDPPNFTTRCQILQQLARRASLSLSEDVIGWIARRVTQNVRELEGAITRVTAHVKLSGRVADLQLVQEALGDLEKQMIAPVKPENILGAVCQYFGLEMRDLMSGRRQRTISLARSVAMHLIRKTAKLSFPEIGSRLGKRNHSTVISACRRMERACTRNEKLTWCSAIGQREEEAIELVQRLEELSRALN